MKKFQHFIFTFVLIAMFVVSLGFPVKQAQAASLWDVVLSINPVTAPFYFGQKALEAIRQSTQQQATAQQRQTTTSQQQRQTTAQNQTAGSIPTEFGQVSNVGEFISAILVWLNPIIYSLAILMIIYAGYIYMTSQGSQEKTGFAKEILIGVVAGVLLYFTASILLNNVIGVRVP